MNNELKQVLISAKLGDGCFIKYKKYYLSLSSINLDYLCYKRDILKSSGVYICPIKVQKSGFTGKSNIYRFETRVHSAITDIGNLNILDCIKGLDKLGLILYFLDDGSLHKNKRFGHIYCNTFTDIEVKALIDIIYSYYPLKRCSKRMDKKKNGREYPYIYIPVSTMFEMSKDVRSFLEHRDIKSLLYKTIPPSQTIEKVTIK